MKLGLGIDTGGTYTDAVLYNFDTGEVASAAKAPTTKENLEIGILQALDALDSEHLKDVKLVSLSTTLATNACVEGRHGAAKLILSAATKRWCAKTARPMACLLLKSWCFWRGR